MSNTMAQDGALEDLLDALKTAPDDGVLNDLRDEAEADVLAGLKGEPLGSIGVLLFPPQQPRSGINPNWKKLDVGAILIVDTFIGELDRDQVINQLAKRCTREDLRKALFLDYYLALIPDRKQAAGQLLADNALSLNELAKYLKCLRFPKHQTSAHPAHYTPLRDNSCELEKLAVANFMLTDKFKSLLDTRAAAALMWNSKTIEELKAVHFIDIYLNQKYPVLAQQQSARLEAVINKSNDLKTAIITEILLTKPTYLEAVESVELLSRISEAEEAIKYIDDIVNDLTDNLEKARLLIRKGDCLAKQNTDSQSILHAYDAAIRYAPGLAEAWGKRAEALRPINLTETLNSYQKAIELSQFNNEIALALAYCKQAIQVKSDNSRIWATRARLEAELNEPVAALNSWNTAISLSPANASLQQQKAHTLISLAHFPDAVKAYLRAVDLFIADKDYNSALLCCNEGYKSTKATPLLYRKAKTFEKAGNIDDALLAVSKALQIEPNQSAYYKRAELHSRRGNDVNALADCDRALEYGYSDRAAALKIHILAKLGSLDQAIDACLASAKTCIEQKNARLAVAYCDIALQIRAVPEAYILKAEACVDLNELQNVLDAYRSATSQLVRSRDYGLARACCHAALELAPNDVFFNRINAFCSRSSGDYIDAADAYSKLVAVDASAANFYTLANCLLKTGEYKQALKHFKQAEKLEPNRPHILRGELVCFERLGQYLRARWCRSKLAKAQGYA